VQSPPSKQPRSSASDRKQAARDLLQRHDLEAVRVWARTDRNPMRTLTSLLFDDDPLTRWRALEALGVVAGIEAARNLGRPRRQIQRLLWLMNDESGGICWQAPEAIGEILFNAPDLIPDFGPILPSFFVEEPFERGSRWAVARVAVLDPPLFKDVLDELRGSLTDPDPYIRGYSTLALYAIQGHECPHVFDTLADGDDEFEMYDYASGELKTTTVGEIAARPILLSPASR
jgi:HEAT repeat protein